MTRSFLRASVLAATLAVAACATSDRFGADVTRFHLGAPIARGTVLLEPADPAAANSLEFKTYSAAVSPRLARAGFTPVAAGAPHEFIGVLGYAQTTRQGLATQPPVSVGIGGGGVSGGRGGGFGLGGGISFPLGKRRNQDVAVNALTLRLRRASDQTAVWEGRAIAEARADGRFGPLGEAVPMLADALLANFPGPSGTATRYAPK